METIQVESKDLLELIQKHGINGVLVYTNKLLKPHGIRLASYGCLEQDETVTFQLQRKD